MTLELVVVPPRPESLACDGAYVETENRLGGCTQRALLRNRAPRRSLVNDNTRRRTLQSLGHSNPQAEVLVDSDKPAKPTDHEHAVLG